MISPQVNHEPIPGYRLIERLGRGGYGEVWKAEAPGGLFKAIKFVYGNLEGTDEDGKPAEQELKALNRVKTIRHPYVLSIERFDILDGQLLIVMELADRNLWDRFNECRSQSLTGIPREELLDYLEESAEALDLMNVHYQIQHLDIKPQNLFLVHNHVKVADFGLAKDFIGTRATVTGGVTPVYAAPETFEGWASRFCDQYSLAIVYQELLTGIRPFNGTNARHLLLQHLTAEPDVAPLPKAEQDTIRRALSKKPNDRFPTCVEMIRGLRGQPASIAGIGPVPNEAATPTHRGGGSAVPTMSPRELAERGAPSPSPPAQPAVPVRRSSSRALPALVTPNLMQGTVSTPNRLNDTTAATYTMQRPPAVQTARLTQHGIAPPERTGAGVLFPALIVGLGGTGLAVLKKMRSALRERFGSCSHLPHLRWLFIDTDPDTLQPALSDAAADALSPANVLAARLQRPGHYLRREGLPPVDSWLKGEILYRIPRHPTTLGIRALGRLALIDYYHVLVQRLRAELEPFLSEHVLAAAESSTGLAFRSNRPRVYVVTSLTGGTGAGMVVDLAYVVRHEMRQMGWTKPEVTGVFFLPPVERNAMRTNAVANTYAALAELQHFSQPGVRYETCFDNREPPLVDSEPPYQRAALITFPRGPKPQDTHRHLELAAGHVMQELLTPIGRVLDESRSTYHKARHSTGIPFQTFGLFRLSWPRARLLQIATSRFRLLILRRWLSKNDGLPLDSVAPWVDDQLKRRKIATDAISALLEDCAAEKLGGRTEDVINRILEPITQADAGKLDGLTAYGVLERLLKFFGKAGKAEEAFPGGLNATLQEEAKVIAARAEKQLAEMAIHFIEQPGLRYRGAEHAIQHLKERLRETLETIERNYLDLEVQVQTEFSRFAPLIGGMDSTLGSLFGGRRAVAAEVAELLQSYPRNRYALLLQRALLAVYRILLASVPEYLREVGCCRLQTEEMHRRLAEESREFTSHESTVAHSILPQGCSNLKEAADQFVTTFSAAEVLEFEGHLQLQIRRAFRGVVAVCLELNDHYQRFAELLTSESRDFLEPRLEKASPTGVFFTHRADPQTAQREILRAFDEAAPESEGAFGPTESEVFILGAPSDEQGERFRQLTREVLPNEDLVPAESTDEIVFYRERRCVSIAQLPQAGPLGREAVEAIQNSEHITPFSRCDISFGPLSRE